MSAGAPPAGPTSSPPVALRNEPPAYPRVARQRGQEGIVELRVQVRADGTCGEVVVDKGSGHRVLDRAAVKAVRRWRFRPATRDGRPVDDWIAVPVEFDLEY